MPVPAGSGNYTPDAVGPARTTAEAHRDHPARGSELPRERVARGVGELVDARRLQRARGPRAARRRFDDRPGADRARACPRWSCPTATPRRRGSGSATSTPASTCSARTRTTSSSAATASASSATSTAIVADDHGHAVKIPNVVCMHEEDYGILWKHTEPGPVGAEVRRSAAPRRVVLLDDRQLRLRVLLVLLPRRLDPARGEGDRHRLRRRPASRVDQPARARDRAGRVRARAPAPVLGAPRRRDRRRGQPPRRDRRRAHPDGRGQPVRQRLHLDGDARCAPSRRRNGSPTPRSRASGRCRAPRRRTTSASRPPTTYPAAHRAAHGRPRLVGRRARRVRDEAPVGHRLRPRPSAGRPAATPTPTRAAQGCPPTRPTTARSTAKTSCSGTRSA